MVTRAQQRAERRAKADTLTIRAAHERYLNELRTWQRLRRLGIQTGEPAPPTIQPSYKAAVRRLNRPRP